LCVAPTDAANKKESRQRKKDHPEIAKGAAKRLHSMASLKRLSKQAILSAAPYSRAMQKS
jgi:hypothetical protein